MRSSEPAPTKSAGDGRASQLALHPLARSSSSYCASSHAVNPYHSSRVACASVLFVKLFAVTVGVGHAFSPPMRSAPQPVVAQQWSPPPPVRPAPQPVTAQQWASPQPSAAPWSAPSYASPWHGSSQTFADTGQLG